MAIKVSQDVIDAIKKKGMSSSLKEASAGGASPEFREGVRRMYGENRLGSSQEQAMNEQDKAGVASAAKQEAAAAPKKPVPMPKSAPAAATRKVTTSSEPKKVDSAIAGGIPKAIGKWFTSGNKKAKAEDKVRAALKPPKPPPKPKTQQQIDNEARYKASKFDAQKAK